MKYQEESTKVSIVSVSRRAGAAAARALGGDPVLGRGQRAAALRRVVLDLGQLDRELVLGHGDDPAVLAVDDRDRRAPVALAGDQPVAQAVVDRRRAPRPSAASHATISS